MFHRGLGVPVLPTRKLFELIVDPLIGDSDVESWFEMRSVPFFFFRAFSNYVTALCFSSLDPSDDALFMSAFIPHKLDHVLHFERDSKLLKEGQEANNPYQNIISKVRHMVINLSYASFCSLFEWVAYSGRCVGSRFQ